MEVLHNLVSGDPDSFSDASEHVIDLALLMIQKSQNNEEVSRMMFTRQHSVTAADYQCFLPLKILLFYIKFEKESSIKSTVRAKVFSGVVSCINVETHVFNNKINFFDD